MMNGFITPSGEPQATVREAAEALIAVIDRGNIRVVQVDGEKETQAWVAAIYDLHQALAQPERSRPGLLPDVDHALGAIAAMKRQQPVTPEDIRAIVALAEEGAEQLRSFDVRWNADMRAIERWRAGDGLPSWARAVMADAAALLAATGDERHGATAQAIERELELQRPGGGELVWPDHADLVVWLLQVLDTTFDGPAVLDVANMIGRLKGQRASGGMAIYGEAAELIEQMAESMRKLARKAFLAEEKARKLESERNTRSPSGADALAFMLGAGKGRRDFLGGDVEYTRVGNVERMTIAGAPATIEVELNEITKGHNIRAEGSDGTRYEGVAIEQGRATLALVPQIGEESADGE